MKNIQIMSQIVFLLLWTFSWDRSRHSDAMILLLSDNLIRNSTDHVPDTNRSGFENAIILMEYWLKQQPKPSLFTRNLFTLISRVNSFSHLFRLTILFDCAVPHVINSVSFRFFFVELLRWLFPCICSHSWLLCEMIFQSF